MSTGSFASVLTGVGIVVSVYLAGIAGLLGLMSATGTAASKKLIKKAEKHEKTVSLAEAKHRSICRLVSKACQGGSISDGEFASIMSEVKQYYDLKAKVIKYDSLNTVEKVQEATLRGEIKKEFHRKLDSLLTIDRVEN